MSTFTLFHVALSLVGIFAGFPVILDLIRSKVSRSWTHVFLSTTLATTVTGFMFPYNGFTPAIGTGIVSLLVLIPVFVGFYRYHLTGHWRWIYVVGAVFAQYLNFFVLIVQLFLKVPALHALAPTQKEPPFAIAQGAALVLFAVLGFAATIKFRPATNPRAA